MVKTVIPLWFYGCLYIGVLWHHYTFKVIKYGYLGAIRILFHSLIVATIITAVAFYLMR